MKSIDPTTSEHVTAKAVRRPAKDALDRILPGPLARPVRRLWRDLDALVQDGSLLEVELDPTHADCPCFLLRVGPNEPQFYVELFMGDLDDTFEENEEVPLCVLMNWLGSDTPPASWEADWEVDSGEEPDLGEVLSHILSMTRSRLLTEVPPQPV